MNCKPLKSTNSRVVTHSKRKKKYLPYGRMPPDACGRNPEVRIS